METTKVMVGCCSRGIRILYSALACVPLIAPGSTTYEGTIYPTTASAATSMGYVTLNNQGDWYQDSPFGASATSHNGYHYWSDNLAPDSAKNYFAGNCRSVTGGVNGQTDAKCSFGGNRLVLSGTCQWKTQAPYYMDFPRDGAIILPGVIFQNNQGQNRAVEQRITGTITVLATGDRPFCLKPTYGPPTASSINLAGFDLACTLRGPVTAAIECRPIQGGAARGWLRVTGETSGYHGSLNIISNDLHVGACGLANAYVSLAQTATLRPFAADGGTVAVAALAVDGQSEIVLNPSNCLAVTDTLSLAVGAAIRLELGSYAGGASHRAIMTAPVGSGIESHLLDWNLLASDTWRSGGMTVDTADGRETVYLDLADADSLVTLLSSDADATLENSSSAFTNATQWSDAKAVHDGADYLVRSGHCLRTLEEGRFQSADFPMTYPRFPGDSLTIWYNSVLALRQTRMEFGLLRLAPGATLHLGNTHTKYVTGNIALIGADDASPARIVSYYTSLNRTNHVDAALSGTGPLLLTGNAGSGDPRGHVQLGGASTNWTGRMTVTIGNCAVSGRETPTWGNTAFLHITNALALGGARDAFTCDALTLEQCGALCVENGNAVVLDTENRGVLVKDRGQMIVGEASSLAVFNDVTYCGELRKTGPGLLALGGTARFGVDGASSPAAFSNVLNFVEGSFMPLSMRCLDGVAATFGAGVSLVYDLKPADTAFRAKGVVLENAASALAFADAAVPVTFACGAVQFDGGVYKVGLLTAFSEATVRAFAERLVIAKPVAAGSCCVEKVVEQVTGGLWTLSVVIRPSGFTVIIR